MLSMLVVTMIDGIFVGHSVSDNRFAAVNIYVSSCSLLTDGSYRRTESETHRRTGKNVPLSEEEKKQLLLRTLEEVENNRARTIMTLGIS